MTLPHQTRAYETWAPVVGRIFLAVPFLMAAAFKVPGTDMFAMQVAASAAVGIPLPEVAVTLAFILEVVGGIALIIGWKTRLFAFLLVLFTALVTLLFHFNFSDPMKAGEFISHLAMIGGLLYLSTYGAQNVAVATCPLPQGMAKEG